MSLSLDLPRIAGMPPARDGEAGSWAIGLGVALTLHTAAAVLLSHHHGDHPVDMPPAIEIAMMPPSEVPPSEVQEQPQPKLLRQAHLPPPSVPELPRQVPAIINTLVRPLKIQIKEEPIIRPPTPQQMVQMPDRPIEDRRQNTHAFIPTAKPTPPSVQSGHALPNFKAALLARLEHYKRYPHNARARGQQGIAFIRFSIDRLGLLLAATLERSSGVDALDEETLALVHRAQPLPPLPPEITGETLEIILPIEFSLHHG